MSPSEAAEAAAEAAAAARWREGWRWRAAPQRRASQRLRDVLDQLRLELSLRRRPAVSVLAAPWPREPDRAWQPDQWRLPYENIPPAGAVPAWAGGARGVALGGGVLLLLLAALKLLDHCYTRVLQGRTGRSAEWSTSAVAINNMTGEATDADPLDFDPFGLDAAGVEDFPPPYSECSTHKNMDRPPPYADCVVDLGKDDEIPNSNTEGNVAIDNVPTYSSTAGAEDTDLTVNDTGQSAAVDGDDSGEADKETGDVLIRIGRLEDSDVVNV